MQYTHIPHQTIMQIAFYLEYNMTNEHCDLISMDTCRVYDNKLYICGNPIGIESNTCTYTYTVYF